MPLHILLENSRGWGRGADQGSGWVCQCGWVRVGVDAGARSAVRLEEPSRRRHAGNQRMALVCFGDHPNSAALHSRSAITKASGEHKRRSLRTDEGMVNSDLHPRDQIVFEDSAQSTRRKIRATKMIAVESAPGHSLSKSLLFGNMGQKQQRCVCRDHHRGCSTKRGNE